MANGHSFVTVGEGLIAALRKSEAKLRDYSLKSRFFGLKPTMNIKKSLGIYQMQILSLDLSVAWSSSALSSFVGQQKPEWID